MSGFYVICFDVCDAKRLRKIADQMENFGTRVQRSVFECHLETAQLQELQRRVENLLAADEDQVRYYGLCGKDKSKILIDGTGTLTGDPDYTMI